MSQPAVELRHPTPEDCEELATNMRAQDAAEMAALGFTDLRQVVWSCVADSVWCDAVLVDGRLACIFGLGVSCTAVASFGSPWMLGTPLVPKHRRILARLAPGYIAKMLQGHPHLINRAHAKNTLAVAWLKRVGFTLHTPTPVAPTGALFHTFERRANDSR
jgi:hypothetical protein